MRSNSPLVAIEWEGKCHIQKGVAKKGFKKGSTPERA